MSNFELTDDQKSALIEFTKFLVTPDEKYLIIQGAAGSGKSTLIEYLVKTLEAQYRMYALLLRKDKTQSDFEVSLTATTNKAVAVLSDLTRMEAMTIHSLLKLTVLPNLATGEIRLTRKRDYCLLYNKLIIVDESSMINDDLFRILDETTIDCKIILIGDKYQLAPVKQKISVMETIVCPKVTMNKVMRHSGNILQVASQFRETVETGVFKNIPDHPELVKVDGPEFQRLIDEAFTSKDYSLNSAKVLAWTNQKVLNYNKHIRKIKGYSEEFKVGETVYTNKPIMLGNKRWSTDAQIKVTDVGPVIYKDGLNGRFIELDHKTSAFLPDSQFEAKNILKVLAKQKNWTKFYGFKDGWLDLRPAYASTIHKSQGDQFNSVFIDLSDIGRCNIQSDVARMLYVSISRSSKQIYFYGELPFKYSGD